MNVRELEGGAVLYRHDKSKWEGPKPFVFLTCLERKKPLVKSPRANILSCKIEWNSTQTLGQLITSENNSQMFDTNELH